MEATKYTEVGYVGRDVESMIRDLMSAGMSMVRAEMQVSFKDEAEKRAEEALLDLLLPGGKKDDAAVAAEGGSETREKFRTMLREGKFDDRKVEVTVSSSAMPSIEMFSGSSFEEMDMNFSSLSNLFGGKRKKKLASIKDARELLLGEEFEKLIDQDRVAEEARRRVEEMGIVFIDEIDKIANKDNKSGGVDVSREGVQRDILPIVEGCTVNTRNGPIDTSHILFIAAGAFNVSKPSDLIPELQGRFPLRVELEPLHKGDFIRILTEPKNALTVQYRQLIATEGVTIDFEKDAIERMSEIAEEVNARAENIGARRLHTIMEILLEDVSFNAPDLKGQTIKITTAYVNERFKDFIQDQDLSRYIL